ncbi:MAG: PSD1 and planctomycete cytochrome C domain-containing protein [Bryobacteraceae bacterium]
MSDTCFRCHGPDKSSRIAGFRLDIREEALKPLKDGAIPIVPGDPEKSAIVQRIFAPTVARRMPPQSAHKELTGKQKDTFRRWVAEGAVYEGHWAYEPVRRPRAPELADSKAPPHNPIDNFIQDRLVREGLTASPEADRRTLIRRVTLDLTGMLPTPADVASFESDPSPAAYQRVVDRLLASPHYAEQRTMHWLDAVRYADTCGFHGDNIFPAWPYRDYVLNSFRDNKPFDVFTREQLAGDLLPNATTDQKVASAYNRLNRTSAEGGLQPKEYLAKYGADRVRTVSAVWLGTTTGCAECHDHKFDPILTKDFYAMKAFFADVEETGLMPDRGVKAWGTQIELPTPEQQEMRKTLDARIAQATQALAAAQKSLSFTPEQEKALLDRWQAGGLAWTFQKPIGAESANGAKLTLYNNPVQTVDSPESTPGNGLIVASGPNPDNEVYTVTLRPGEGRWTALGVDVGQDESLPGNRVSRGADRFVLTGVEATLEEPNRAPRNLAISLATGDQSPQNGMPAMAVLDHNPNTGWGAALGDSGNPFLALRFASALNTTSDSRIAVRLRHESVDYRRAVLGRFRLALSSAVYSWPADGDTAKRMKSKSPNGEKTWASGLPDHVVAALQAEPGKRTDIQRKDLADYQAWASADLAPLRIRLETLNAEANMLEASIAHVVTTVAATPRETRILPRGNWMDDSAPIVEPAIPERFGKLDTGGKRASRLDLANWIGSPDNPLTARVFANRIWRQFFGTGISKVLDDVGSQGEWPTHPELLDWLASEFMHPEWDAAGTHAWDVKHLVRTIVLSHTYRQASIPTPVTEAKDPENRLLARQARFRVEAESVRDIALQVSGLMNEAVGGPSVRPYQPDGYLATLNFPKREYSASRDEDLYRRGVYTFWRRTFLHPALLNFDAPTREECTVNRVISNTPLQALDLLNDPIFIEAARVFAEKAVQTGGASFTERLDWAFQQSLNRKPTVQERGILESLYKKNLQRFTATPASAREFVRIGDAPLPGAMNLPQLAAMTTVTRVLLNLHETITRN